MDKALLFVSMKNRPAAETGELVLSAIFGRILKWAVTPEEGKGEKESQNAHDHWEQLVAVNFWQPSSLSTVGEWNFTPAASS